MGRLTGIMVLTAGFWLFGANAGWAENIVRGEHKPILYKRLHGKHHYDYQERTSLKRRGDRELPFEVLRMLSVGMSKIEGLSRAVAPHYTLGSSACVYSSTDQWIVELSFAAGKVIAINWSRP